MEASTLWPPMSRYVLPLLIVTALTTPDTPAVVLSPDVVTVLPISPALSEIRL